MRHRHFQLASEAATALQAAEQHAPNGATRSRMQAVRLYGLGYAVADIQIITGLSPSRLMECCRAYEQDGIAALLATARAATITNSRPPRLPT